MAISSCSTCSSGGSIEAIRQYQADALQKRDEKRDSPSQTATAPGREEGINRPLAGEAIGSQINISA